MAKKILIIEDHKETAELMSSIVQMKGYDFTHAYEGLIGLQKAEAEKPDLILLDVMLPGMDGIKVLGELKANPKTAKIPVIIVSVKAGNGDVKAGMEAGANGYVTKPFEPDKLAELINKYI